MGILETKTTKKEIKQTSQTIKHTDNQNISINRENNNHFIN